MSPREEAIARVRAALDRDSTCAWAIAPESVAHLMAAYDEARKEREEYRAVVARQIEDKRRLLAERDEARQHHENALAISAHNIERVKQLDAENKAQFETLDTLRGLHDQLLAAVMDGTAEFREWQECEADAIEGQEEEVERDHNRMLAALHALRRKAQHVQSGTRAVVEAGSLPSHLERADLSELVDAAQALVSECDGLYISNVIACGKAMGAGISRQALRDVELARKKLAKVLNGLGGNCRQCGQDTGAHRAPDGGGCAGDFADQLPKGPAHGRFTDAERAELDDLKRKAFEHAKSAGGAP